MELNATQNSQNGLCLASISAFYYEKTHFQRRAADGKSSHRQLSRRFKELGQSAKRIRELFLHRQSARDHAAAKSAGFAAENAGFVADLSRLRR